MLSFNQKQKIADAIKNAEPNYQSAARFAVVLGINASQLSRVKGGEVEKILSDQAWISIARRLGVNLKDKFELKPAKTPVFAYINTQLNKCQENSLGGLLCDAKDIGKTFAGRYYARTSKNVAFIDCSQAKTRQLLIRAISREFGLGAKGRYTSVYADLVLYLQTSVNPLIILDEAGDLDYRAFLELKALWNATEFVCGWYMMGANGLKAKIEDNMSRNKVGYEEIFSRFGDRFQKITPDGDGADKDFAREQTSIIAKVNSLGDAQKLFAKTQGSLRRIRIEAQKQKHE